jgi:hypothetical protein
MELIYSAHDGARLIKSDIENIGDPWLNPFSLTRREQAGAGKDRHQKIAA